METQSLGRVLALVIARDLRLAVRHWDQVAQPLTFFVIVTTLFPLAISPALEELRQREENPPFVRQLVPLDMSPRLTRDDFYTLDDHMRPHGQQVVGEALAQLLSGVARAGGSGR